MPTPANCPLKPVDVEVIRHLSLGKSAKIIAQDMNTNTDNVNRCVARAMKALHVNAATGLVGEAFRKGWIQ